MHKRSLFAIFIVVFIDLLGFSLILPLLPYYAGSYGANPTLIGLLVASYAAAQFVGAPILGRLSDRLGRRPILLLSIGGTFAGFLLLAGAPQVGAWAARLLRPEALAADLAATRNALVMAWVVSFAWQRLIVRPDAPLPPRPSESFGGAAPLFPG